MSTIKSSAENLTLNADGANNDIKFQSNGSEVASIDQDGNLSIGLNQDIPMDGTASGQLQIDGLGYKGAIALDADAMYIYTNSSARDVVLGVNETEILRAKSAGIDVTGDADVSVNLNLGGHLVYTGSSQIQSTAQTGNLILSGGNNSNQGANIVAYGPSHASNPSVTRFRTNGTDRMRISSTGEVTMPAQPAFSAKPSTTQSNIASSGDWVNVAFGTELFDVGGDFASNIFTAPVTGKYMLGYSLRLQNVDILASYIYLKIYTSNLSYQTIYSPKLTSDPQYSNSNLSVLADMDVGDSAYVQILQNGGTAQMDIQNSQSHFFGYLLG